MSIDSQAPRQPEAARSRWISLADQVTPKRREQQAGKCTCSNGLDRLQVDGTPRARHSTVVSKHVDLCALSGQDLHVDLSKRVDAGKVP